MPGKKSSPGSLSHIDRDGNAAMVDVSKKRPSLRTASATAIVSMHPQTLALLLEDRLPKKSVFTTARIAGILAAKKTDAIIPLCHPLPISSAEIDFEPDRKKGRIRITSRISVTARTGVEMEALTAVTVAALTIYDMCKAVEKEIMISDIVLLEKKGGKSGTFVRPSKNR